VFSYDVLRSGTEKKEDFTRAHKGKEKKRNKRAGRKNFRAKVVKAQRRKKFRSWDLIMYLCLVDFIFKWFCGLKLDC
jgi:hypothetical protein